MTRTSPTRKTIAYYLGLSYIHPRTMRVLFVAVCALTALAPASARSTVVQTNSGPVEGYATAKGLIWQGIPYAEPPIGQQRWKNPTPVAAWTDTKEAKAFGPACPQVTRHCGCPNHFHFLQRSRLACACHRTLIFYTQLTPRALDLQLAGCGLPR